MSPIALAEGALFAGRYRVARCIAAGGMGAVYEVIHLETERRRALKVMLPHFAQSPDMRDRFRQEARVAAHIDSEFIVDVFDAGIDDATGMPFLVMELLRGEELGKLLSRRGRMTPPEVVTFLHQASLALDKTHQAMIVHRDLKPENLFVTLREDGAPRIKILDFGIAKVVAESGTQANATRSLGTPLYMAPEQFRPGHRVSPLTDLYALGMMAYTLLVGRAYWAEEACDGGNIFTFASQVMHGPQEAATARALRAGAPLPPAFDSWFSVATAREPEHRFRSATAMVAALAEALSVPIPGFAAVSSPLLGGFTARPDGAEAPRASTPIPRVNTPIRSPNLSSTEVLPFLSGSTPAPAASAPGAAATAVLDPSPPAIEPIAAASTASRVPAQTLSPEPVTPSVLRSTGAATTSKLRNGKTLVLGASIFALTLMAAAGLWLVAGRSQEAPSTEVHTVAGHEGAAEPRIDPPPVTPSALAVTPPEPASAASLAPATTGEPPSTPGPEPPPPVPTSRKPRAQPQIHEPLW